MSEFLDKKYAGLNAYTPGEQPRDMQYVKLNTNESPFPPPKEVTDAIAAEGAKANLYCDPTCRALREKAAQVFGVKAENVLAFNGSDETLYFAFMAFCEKGVAYPQISYGFYPVFAELCGTDAMEIPLAEGLWVNPDDYCGIGRTVVIANPNAPTGLCLDLAQIEKIVSTNPENAVIIDEAYIAFGGESALPLIKKYDNLLIVRTFSKSHSLAGARLGFGIASEKLIKDLELIRYSTNPYNVNRMTQGAGIAALGINGYFEDNCKIIAQNREYTAAALKKLGFVTTDSKANFIFAKSDKIAGETLYKELKNRGVLVRWFSKAQIKDYVRITVGTREQMDILLNKIQEVLKDADK